MGSSALLTGVNNTTISCADSPHGMRFIREFSVLFFFLGVLPGWGGCFTLVLGCNIFAQHSENCLRFKPENCTFITTTSIVHNSLNLFSYNLIVFSGTRLIGH